MKSTNCIVIASFIIFLFSTSCQKILEQYPQGEPSDVTFLQSEEELQMAINGAYNNLWFNSISATGQFEYVIDCATDISFDRNGGLFTEAGNGTLIPAESSLETVWSHFYTGIGRCNFILTNMHKVKGGSQKTLRQIAGQARFLRAYWYSWLLNLWGDVPYITMPLGIDDEKLARTNTDVIVDSLLLDLDSAAAELPVSWPGDDRGRATRGAALALKSRIALNAGRYKIAADAAKQVIDGGQYELFPNYRDLFTYKGENSSEIIFKIIYQYGIEDHRLENSLFSRNAKGTSTKVPTQSMVDSYECIDGLTIDKSPLYDPTHPFKNRDPRLQQSIAVPGSIFLGFQFETYRDSIECWNYNVLPPKRIANQDALNPYATFTGYCWRKFVNKEDMGEFRNHSSLDCIVIRYAEVLLNYAEAKIELNQIDASCLSAINIIRGRPSVKMPPIEPGKSQSEMRQIIRRERKVELAMEGFRLGDIRRWGIAEKVMQGPLYGRPQKPFNYSDQGIPSFDKDGVPDYSSYADKLSIVEPRTFNSNRDYLWPIPQSELDIDNKLDQNPGY